MLYIDRLPQSFARTSLGYPRPELDRVVRHGKNFDLVVIVQRVMKRNEGKLGGNIHSCSDDVVRCWRSRKRVAVQRSTQGVAISDDAVEDFRHSDYCRGTVVLCKGVDLDVFPPSAFVRRSAVFGTVNGL